MRKDDRMTVPEVARELGISPSTVLYRLKAGLLSGENYGGRVWLIPREEVERAKMAGPVKRGPKPGAKRKRAEA